MSEKPNYVKNIWTINYSDWRKEKDADIDHIKLIETIEKKDSQLADKLKSVLKNAKKIEVKYNVIITHRMRMCWSQLAELLNWNYSKIKEDVYDLESWLNNIDKALWIYWKMKGTGDDKLNIHYYWWNIWETALNIWKDIYIWPFSPESTVHHEIMHAFHWESKESEKEGIHENQEVFLNNRINGIKMLLDITSAKMGYPKIAWDQKDWWLELMEDLSSDQVLFEAAYNISVNNISWKDYIQQIEEVDEYSWKSEKRFVIKWIPRCNWFYALLDANEYIASAWEWFMISKKNRTELLWRAYSESKENIDTKWSLIYNLALCFIKTESLSYWWKIDNVNFSEINRELKENLNNLDSLVKIFKKYFGWENAALITWEPINARQISDLKEKYKIPSRRLSLLGLDEKIINENKKKFEKDSEYFQKPEDILDKEI